MAGRSGDLDRRRGRYRIGNRLADRSGRNAKRKADRLSRVRSGGLYADEGGNLRAGLPRTSETQPFGDARVDLVGAQILCGDDSRLGPIAAKRMGQCKILPQPGVGAPLPRCRLEHGDRILRAPGQRKRKACLLYTSPSPRD